LAPARPTPRVLSFSTIRARRKSIAKSRLYANSGRKMNILAR
jgi:hypothetical protein